MDMLQAMRYMPHWQPIADHLLEFSCTPTAVSYKTKAVSYTVSCDEGKEALKLTFAPRAVTAGGKALAAWPAGTVYGGGHGDGYGYDESTGLLIVQHSASGEIRVQGNPSEASELSAVKTDDTLAGTKQTKAQQDKLKLARK